MPIFENKLWRTATLPLSWLFGAGVYVRNRAYDLGLIRQRRIPARVLSIGNLTVGGSGKTPMTMWLALRLQSRGFRPAVLSRGYRRRSRGTLLVSSGEGPLYSTELCGDEPYLMATRLPGVPICVDADRYRGATFLLQRFRPDVILLDDGFQHRRLYRNLDVVLLDPDQHRKNSLLLPAGPFRESMAALRRAGIVCLIHSKECVDQIEIVTSTIRKFYEGEVFRLKRRTSHLWQPILNKKESLDGCLGCRAVVMAGIGHPQPLIAALHSAGVETAALLLYPDHARYEKKDIDRLQQVWRDSRAERIITTAKDWVKLAGLAGRLDLPIWVAELELITDQQTEDRLMARVVEHLEAGSHQAGKQEVPA